MQANFVPLLLLFAGVVGAAHCAYMQVFDSGAEYAVLFAIACLVACIGWSELTASEESN
jgi:hypothetical protein